MTDTGERIGIELIREIAAQDMIKATPIRDPQGHHTGSFRFTWAGNADEQLEGHLYHILRNRGLAILPVDPAQIPDLPFDEKGT